MKEIKNLPRYLYLWLIHVDTWQKPTQHCKVIILQLKIKKSKQKKPTKLAWFPIGPVVKDAPCNAGDMVSTPGQATKTLHILGQLSSHAVTR